MRRRPIVPRRPALPRHAIVWFAPPAATTAIEAFRARNDPQAAAIAAHVTLVFPFATTLTSLQVAAHARRTVAQWPRLPVRIEGVATIAGEWVVLALTQGAAAVTELHDRLYRGPLAPFLRREFDYTPHLTIGRAADAAALAAMAPAAAKACAAPLAATIDALAIVTLWPDGRVTRARDVGFG
jgi:2'-5' RNA ligase